MKNIFLQYFLVLLLLKTSFSYFIKINIFIYSFYKIYQKEKRLPSKFYKIVCDKDLNRNLVVGIEEVILNQHFELKIGYLSQIVIGKLFLKKFHDAIAEATKALVPYFEVLHVGFIKRPCDANLIY